MYDTIKQAAEAIMERISAYKANGEGLIIAIDGRCGSGKTTLAAYLATLCDCEIIPMDHFFLRPEQRTEERLAEPGGNVDYERFLEEVAIPLFEKRPFSYRPYSCKTKQFEEARRMEPKNIIVVEGSYSCHPKLREFYDMTVFLSVGQAEQLRRIEERNGAEQLKAFKEKWIPMEENYFRGYKVKEQCMLCFKTDEKSIS